MAISHAGLVRNFCFHGSFKSLAETLDYCRKICIREDEYSDVFGFVFPDHSVILVRKSDGKPTF